MSLSSTPRLENEPGTHLSRPSSYHRDTPEQQAARRWAAHNGWHDEPCSKCGQLPQDPGIEAVPANQETSGPRAKDEGATTP